jgi:hypothetical protein
MAGWLAHLLRPAMIHPSFIPPWAIRELRDLTRGRKRLLRDETGIVSFSRSSWRDPFFPPGRILCGLSRMTPQVLGQARSARRPGLPAPEETESLAAPGARDRASMTLFFCP